MRLHILKNCWQQDITKSEYTWITIKSIAITGITAWLFYRSLWAVFLLAPVGGWNFWMLVQEQANQKEKEFQLQFKEAILAVSSAMNIGYSVENAFREAQKELKKIYPEEARISKELQMIVRQLRVHVPMEQILEELSQRAPTEDVRNFVTVFVAAKKSGGNMIAIIQNTANQIGDKMDVKREIDTILAAKRYEFRVMSVVPYAIIGYMSLSFPEFMECLYGNILGIGVMTICLVIYLAAYYLGLRIIRIEV
ncbi:type II secretion system F family protein [Bariatricus sp. SGI.161]|uniref:type II secretion system F family protein n=1 Tax=Bariatricus sp. SGI.161 TaxID=3420550 RepID=UPI003D06E910